MARIRTIKPEFWTDEKIVQLPYEARLMFIGLWNFCDDEGYLWDEPRRIKMQIMPDDDVDSENIIDILSAVGLIDIYENGDGKRFLAIKHFQDHQKVDHPATSKIPREDSRKVSIPAHIRRVIAIKYGCEPGGKKEAVCYYCGSKGQIYWSSNRKTGNPASWVQFKNLEIDHLEPESVGGETKGNNLILACRDCNRSKNNKDLFTFIVKTREGSRGVAPEGKGREGKGKEGNGRDRNTRKQKTGIPSDFQISDQVKAWAIKNGYSNLEDHFESFKLKCQAKGYEYIDWDAAFRNAIKDDWAGLKRGGNGSKGNQDRNAGIKEWLKEKEQEQHETV